MNIFCQKCFGYVFKDFWCHGNLFYYSGIMPDTLSDQSSVPASEDSNRHSWEPEKNYHWLFDHDPSFEFNSGMWGPYLPPLVVLSVRLGDVLAAEWDVANMLKSLVNFKNTDSQPAKFTEKLGKYAHGISVKWLVVSVEFFDLIRHRHQVFFGHAFILFGRLLGFFLSGAGNVTVF